MKATLTHKVILCCVQANPRCTTTELVRLSHLHRSTIWNAITQLQEQKLVTRSRPSRGDRRQIMIELTDRGHKVLQAHA